MKKALLIAATLVSASAFASVGVSVRSDYVNQMKNDKAGIAGSSTFEPSYARINMGGKVGEAEIKGSLDLTARSAVAADALSAVNFVNHLYIKKSFNDGWAMSAGKLVNPTGGFEAESIDAGNDYNASLANGGAGLGTIATGGTARLGNASGVGVHWMSGSHAVEIQATNDTDKNATAAPEKSHNYGLAYTGGLTESLWLKASYFAGFTDDGTPTDSDQTYMGVGIRWAAAPFDLTFDYLANGTKPVGGSEDKTTSMVVNFRYAMESWTPFAKVEMSEVKPNGADADKKTGLTIGAEMAHGSDFRYHLAYVMNTFDPAAAGDNQTDTKIIAGIKWDADLLK